MRLRVAKKVVWFLLRDFRTQRKGTLKNATRILRRGHRLWLQKQVAAFAGAQRGPLPEGK